MQLNEMLNSCFNSSSSTSTATPTDVLSSKSEFPSDPPKDEQEENILPDIERLREKIPPELFNELKNLLKEYEPIFRKSKGDLGKCTVMEHKIDLQPGSVPWKEGPRRMTPLKTEKANEEVRELIHLGLIEPSDSPWACGIVMAKKKATNCACAATSVT